MQTQAGSPGVWVQLLASQGSSHTHLRLLLTSWSLTLRGCQRPGIHVSVVSETYSRLPGGWKSGETLQRKRGHSLHLFSPCLNSVYVHREGYVRMTAGAFRCWKCFPTSGGTEIINSVSPVVWMLGRELGSSARTG